MNPFPAGRGEAHSPSPIPAEPLEPRPALSRDEWLRQMKAGDIVLVRNGGTIHFNAKVDRATATQMIIGTLRFRRSNGSLIRKARHPLPQRIFDGMRLVQSEDEPL